jgi:hypothetical protein
MAKIFGAVAVGAWFIFVSTMLIRGGLEGIHQDQATLSWPGTQGRITQVSYMEAGLDARRSWGCQYEVMLEYAYEVGGRQYRSKKVGRTRDVVCSSDTTLSKVLDLYQAGNYVTVFYEPHSPDVAILEPRVQTSGYVVIAFIGIFDIALLVALWWCVRNAEAGEL